jgi:hypothetical protein
LSRKVPITQLLLVVVIRLFGRSSETGPLFAVGQTPAAATPWRSSLPRPSTRPPCRLGHAGHLRYSSTDVYPFHVPIGMVAVGGALDAAWLRPKRNLQFGRRSSYLHQRGVEEPSVTVPIFHGQSHIQLRRCRVHRRAGGVILRAKYLMRFVLQAIRAGAGAEE